LRLPKEIGAVEAIIAELDQCITPLELTLYSAQLANREFLYATAFISG
jgi:hypothetical protein